MWHCLRVFQGAGDVKRLWRHTYQNFEDSLFANFYFSRVPEKFYVLWQCTGRERVKNCQNLCDVIFEQPHSRHISGHKVWLNNVSDVSQNLKNNKSIIRKCLTSNEQNTPIQKHTAKPFNLVDQLRLVASDICNKGELYQKNNLFVSCITLQKSVTTYHTANSPQDKVATHFKSCC